MTPHNEHPQPQQPPLSDQDTGRGESAGRVDADMVDALAQLSFLVHNTLAEIAGGHDLSIIQTRLLGVLRDREPTMQQLGGLLGLDKSSVSGLVDRAQRRGLVTRTVSATDRRSFQVSITGAGRELVAQVGARFAEQVEASVAPLAPGEQRILTQLATRVVQAHAHRHGIDLRTTTGTTGTTG